MEKFEETFEKWSDINKQLYDDSKAYIEDCLNKLPNNEIEIDVESNVVTICYDGDRYPEYWANPFSQVERVYLKDDKVCLDTEDAIGYSIDRIDASMLCDVALAVKQAMEQIDVEE